MLNGSNELVPAADLVPVTRSLQAVWQQRRLHLAGGGEAMREVDGEEDGEGPPEFSIDTQERRLRVVWEEVAVGEGWCEAPQVSAWGGSIAIFEQGSVPLPRRMGTFRIAVRAAGTRVYGGVSGSD